MSVLIDDREFAGVCGAVTMGIVRGEAIRTWWNSFPPITPINLPGCRPDACMQHFFSRLPIDGGETSAMGCFQTNTFTPRPSPGQPPVSLAEWVSNNFFQKCRWTNPNRTRGGFLYRPVIVMDRGSPELRRVDENLELKLSEIGSRYEWAVVRLDLLDYMRAFPVIGQYNRFLEPLNREAGYMVLHPNFFHSPHPQPPGCVEEYCFAYSVSPWKVRPTIAAYGPGRFHSAYKQFRFYLMENGTVSIEVLFIVAARCHRVFNILGVDPVFHTVELLNALTLRRTSILERAHIGVDRYAMGHHARVHDHVLCGMRQIWENTNWQAARSQEADKLSSGQ